MRNSSDNVSQLQVAFACMWLRRNGWDFDFDAKYRCWDVETPNGWRTASTGRELCSIIQPYIDAASAE